MSMKALIFLHAGTNEGQGWRTTDEGVEEVDRATNKASKEGRWRADGGAAGWKEAQMRGRVVRRKEEQQDGQ